MDFIDFSCKLYSFETNWTVRSPPALRLYTSMTHDEITYQIGIPEKFRNAAVELYDEAFGQKLSFAIPDTTTRKQLLGRSFVLESAVAAMTKDRLMGIAGFHAGGSSLTRGVTYESLLEQLGFFRGNRAAFVFSLYERTPKTGELVMDGICVQKDARGKGIGQHLLNEIKQYAHKNSYTSVRLDVIDTNAQAKKLYERAGFEASAVESFALFRRLLGFGGVTSMNFNTANFID